MTNLNNKISKILIEFNTENQNTAFNKMQKIYEMKPYDIEINKIYGKMAVKLNEKNIATQSFKYILSKIPNDKEILKIYYQLLITLNKFDEALNYIDKLLKIEKDNFKAIKDKAFVFYNLKKFKSARKYIDLAIEIDSEDYFAQNIKGLIHLKENNFKDAIPYFKKAIKLNKYYLDSYNNLGVCFFELDNILSAFSCFKKAYRINQKHPLTLNNLGNVLSLIYKNELALIYYKKALSINPNYGELLTNLSMCYMRMNDVKNADIFFKKSIDMNSNDSELKYAYSTFQLNIGNLDLGWMYYDSRFYKRKNHKSIKNFNLVKNKLANTESIDFKKNTLILREQGLGDEIVFSSIYPDIIKNFNSVKIESDKRLINIFKNSFNKDIFYPEGLFSWNEKKLNEFDQIFYIGSLAKFFRKREAEIPGLPYLIANKEKIKSINGKLEQSNKILRVGISWKSKDNILGNLKSLSISDFIPLFKKNRSIINLQYGDIRKDLDKIKLYKKNIILLKDVDIFNDLDSCIALLKNLDFFITIDNSTAHMAGALGVKTILLRPAKSSAHFYWKPKDGFSIWYKSVKVIDIKESVSKVINAIDKIISK